MTDKTTWKNLWKASNATRTKETLEEYEARAEHAWTTHNEDPGEGIITGDQMEEAASYFYPPEGDTGPIPEVLVEATEPETDESEERLLASQRPIGRTVGAGTAEEMRAKINRTEGGTVRNKPRPSAPVVELKEPVILESPYAGDVERNVSYARRALADCLKHGEAPFAPHLLYTQIGVLDDSDPAERKRGIEAGFMVGKHIKKAVFYVDHGLSSGMREALDRFIFAGKTIEFRYLDDDDFDL